MTGIQSPQDEVARLRHCLRDLVSIVALPNVWAGAEPGQIVHTLLDALSGMLRLAFTFVRLYDPDGAVSVECVRVFEPVNQAITEGEIAGSLAASFGDVSRHWPSGGVVVAGGTALSTAVARFGIAGELGVIVVGAPRSDFPQQTERLVLDVAANQAAIGLQQARLLEEQRRVARELDDRVAQRTSELSAAQERLAKSEYDFRLIVDNIPGLVALLAPNGEVEVVNHQFYGYFGKTLDELKQWGANDTIHPDDRPRAMDAFSKAVSEGTPYDIEQRFRRRDGAYRWFANRGYPLRGPDGAITRWCVLLTDIDERMRAEEALRASEHDARLIIDTIPALVWCQLPDGSNEFISKGWHEFTGIAPEESHGWGWQASFHPDDLPPLLNKWASMLVSGEPGEIEARLRRRDGVYRWFLIRAEPFRNEEGAIVRWYGTSTDIEDRKRAEQALESRGHDLKLIIDTIPTLSWSTEPNGSVDFLSRRWLDFTGLSADQAHGFGWSQAVHPDDAPGLLQSWQAALASGHMPDLEARLRRADGVYRWFLFRANALCDETGRIAKWYGTNIDIEDRKRAEEEVRRKEALLTKAQRLSLSGTFSWRVDSEDVVFSDEAYRIFGFAPGSLVTLARIAASVHPDDRALLAEQIGGARGPGGDQTYSIRLRMDDGAIKYLRASSQDTIDEAGRREYVGAVQDVTARHIAEESLDKARAELAHVARATSFNTLTASIAHEINQPLSGIITNASTCLRMLNADPPNVDGARETARRTIRDGNRVSDVITRLRALFAKKEFTPESIDLNEVAREVLTLVANDILRHRVVVQSDFDGDLPLVMGDRIQLQQVILNLLRNALDAMSGVNDRARRLLIRTECEQDGSARFSICDAGVGLDGQNVDRIFDSFYTTKSGGMGIGLSVSRSIIEKHRGRLWAERNEGPGATFAFSLPPQREHASTADAAERAL